MTTNNTLVARAAAYYMQGIQVAQLFKVSPIIDPHSWSIGVEKKTTCMSR